MRENRPYGSERGEGTSPSLPLSEGVRLRLSCGKQKPRRFRRGFQIRRSVDQLCQLQVAGGLLAALAEHVEADLLTFREAGQAGALNRGHMHEHVLRPVARLDEAEALLRVEPLHGTSSHSRLS